MLPWLIILRINVFIALFTAVFAFADGKGKMYKESAADLPAERTAPLSMPLNGNLFPEEEIYPVEDDFASLARPNFIQETVAMPEKRILEQSFTLSTRQEVPVNQRKITKIIAFFDDGSFQEMQ